MKILSELLPPTDLAEFQTERRIKEIKGCLDSTLTVDKFKFYFYNYEWNLTNN